MSVFLSKASCLLRKDKKTVRRWCERGFIPGAYRTAGGHWRANGFSAKTANAILRRVHKAGFSRKRLRVGSMAAVKHNRTKIEAYRLARELRMTEAMSSVSEIRQFISKKATPTFGMSLLLEKQFTEEELDQYLATRYNDSEDRFQCASGKSAILAKITLCARRLRLAGVHLTRENLAREMRLSESTLNRRLRTIGRTMDTVKDGVALWDAPAEIKREYQKNGRTSTVHIDKPEPIKSRRR